MNEPRSNRVIFALLCFYTLLSMISMAPMNISFFLLFGVSSFFLILNRKTFHPGLTALPDFKPYLQAMGFLTFACTLSLIVAKISPAIYADHAPDITVHGILKIWYLLCPLILLVSFIQAGGTKERLFQVLKCWGIATLVLAVVAVIQFQTGWPLAQVIPTNPTHFHAILFLGHHLSTSSILPFPTFVALSLFFGKLTRTGKADRFELVVGLAGLLILFLSYARTAWLAIPIGIILLFARYLKPKTLFASLAAFFLLIGIGSQTSLMKERIQNNMGIQDRLRLWEANIDFFKHRPITGIGWLKTQEMSEFYFKTISPDHYREYFWGHAHSNFFEMLGGTGLLGLIAFLFWTFFTLRLCIRTTHLAREQGHNDLADIAWGIFTALLLLHFNGLTNVTFWEGKVMHTQMFSVAIVLMIQFILTRKNRT